MVNIGSPFWLGHDRDFIWGPRGFSSVEEHDKTIIKNWNQLVSWDDEVWVLGDLMLNDNEGGVRKINQLAGNIKIIYGNHDSASRIKMYSEISPRIKTIGYADILKYKGYSFYLSHYPTLCANGGEKPLEREVVNICGHTHTQNKFSDMDKGLIFHCEMDTNNCCPWLLDDIIEDIKNYMKGRK